MALNEFNHKFHYKTNHQPKFLAADEINFYDKNGYVVVRNCVPEAELNKYR